jgi:phage shock protein A
MGVFRRLTDIISANVNDLIDKAEDPEKMAKQIIREMEESIGEIRGQVARAMAAEHQLAAQLNAARADAIEWQQRALRAVELDKDDLARQALLKRRTAEQTAQQVEPQLEQARRAADLLRQQLHSLEDRIMLARRKRDTIIARQRMAEAQSAVNRSMGQFGKASDHLARMTGLADRVDEMEARSRAELTLMHDELPLEVQFERIEEAQSLEAELAVLKEQVRTRSSEGPQADPAG